MNDSLIQTFALTFGFPYTQTRQELPPLEGGRHLHLGALDGFYRHMDGAWHGENPLADYWLEMETLFLQWLTYARLPDIWNDWAFGWDIKAEQYLPIEGWREEWAMFGVMFDDSIFFCRYRCPRQPCLLADDRLWYGGKTSPCRAVRGWVDADFIGNL